jgi:hypothetical protein
MIVRRAGPVPEPLLLVFGKPGSYILFRRHESDLRNGRNFALGVLAILQSCVLS